MSSKGYVYSVWVLSQAEKCRDSMQVGMVEGSMLFLILAGGQQL